MPLDLASAHCDRAAAAEAALTQALNDASAKFDADQAKAMEVLEKAHRTFREATLVARTAFDLETMESSVEHSRQLVERQTEYADALAAAERKLMGDSPAASKPKMPATAGLDNATPPVIDRNHPGWLSNLLTAASRDEEPPIDADIAKFVDADAAVAATPKQEIDTDDRIPQN